MRRRSVRTAFVALCVGVASSQSAQAASLRPRFEPTDLELEDIGTIEADLQIGPTSGDATSGRLYAPDYEIDVGLSSRVELDVDGAFALEPLRRGRTAFAVGEPLWTSVKLGLLDIRDVGPARAAAFGVQLGPRLPLGSDQRGVGYALLTLAGLELGRAHLIFNAGALVDPAPRETRARPCAVVGGVDATIDLDASKRWSFVAALGGGYYVADFPHQLTATGGVAFDTGSTQWSVVTLVSPVGGSDRVGLLLGLSSRWKIF